MSLDVATVWDRLIASDPGLGRLLLATRTTLAVVATVAAVNVFTTAEHLPLSIALLGAIVAMQASLAVNDPAPKLTTLLVPLPGLVGIALGALCAPHAVLAELVFLVVLFAAGAVRALGKRWTAFGIVATMTYFFALFFGANLGQLPALAAAVVIGAAFSYLARFIVLPDLPKWTAGRMLAAFEARTRLVVVAVQDLLGARDLTSAQRKLTAAVQRLNETAVSIEGRLGSDASDEVRIVFDAELAAEDLAAAALRLRTTGKDVPRALSLALRALTHGRVARGARIAGLLLHEQSVSDEAAAVAAAIVDLQATIGLVDATAAALTVSDMPWGNPTAAEQLPALRQALQITVASAAAIVLGEALSPQRWYWAVLAAFFVFNGTASSGDTLAKAWARIVGTALGVGAGIFVGEIAGGRPLLAGVLILVCLFFGVYFLRISLALMMFFITALLALLYTEMGRFSDGLLGIRLAETAIGAACGGLAATLILPTRTRDVARARAGDALTAARDVVHAGIARLLDPAAVESPLDAARTLETNVQQFVARAKPSVGAPVLTGRGHELRRWIVSLSACSYYARTLARVVERSEGATGGRAGTILRRLDDAIAFNILAAAERINGKHETLTVDTPALFNEMRRSIAFDGPPSPALESATHLLERLDRTIARLARSDTLADKKG